MLAVSGTGSNSKVWIASSFSRTVWKEPWNGNSSPFGPRLT